MERKYAGSGWSKKTSWVPRRKKKGGGLNISFIGAIFHWTRWRNPKRALYFASKDDSLLKFADIGDFADLKRREKPTLRDLIPP